MIPHMLSRLTIDKWLPVTVAVVLGAAVGAWLSTGSTIDLDQRVPGTDRTAMSASVRPTQPAGPIEGKLTQGDGEPGRTQGRWRSFRGDDNNAVAENSPRLGRDWPPGGPPTLWRIDVGEGYAGAAIRAGRVYLIDYDREAASDVLRCLSFDTGEDIWRYAYPIKVKRSHGMSRTVPAVTDTHVVSLGPKCHVLCCDAETGERKWLIDMVSEYGTTVPPWYAGQCPLIEDDRVILAPAGTEALMVALDLETGEELWRTPNDLGWRMTHSSIVAIEVAGRRMYVYCGSGGVAGVDAATGELLWNTDAWRIDIATVPTPVVIPGDRLLLSGGYNAGSMMMQIVAEGETYRPEVLYELKPDVFGAAQQTPIFFDGHIYGVRPDGQFVCLTLDGEVRWTSGAANRFGLGPYLIADDLIFVLDDDGQLTMAEATPEAWRPLASADVLDGHEAWGPMAIVAGRLLARDLTTMACLNVSRE